MMFNNKKGYMTSSKDFMKGIILGIILGAIFVFLVAKGILPLFPICG
ncbi:MAG: hypothetical protein ACQESE_03935 [Nanobdellota archaeon]